VSWNTNRASRWVRFERHCLPLGVRRHVHDVDNCLPHPVEEPTPRIAGIPPGTVACHLPDGLPLGIGSEGVTPDVQETSAALKHSTIVAAIEGDSGLVERGCGGRASREGRRQRYLHKPQLAVAETRQDVSYPCRWLDLYLQGLNPGVPEWEEFGDAECGRPLSPLTLLSWT
jgi:hypothetical protein